MLHAGFRRCCLTTLGNKGGRRASTPQSTGSLLEEFLRELELHPMVTAIGQLQVEFPTGALPRPIGLPHVGV